MGLQIRHNLVNRDVIDCNILTRREDATFLSFKVTVKHAEAEKIQDTEFWPKGLRIQPYKPPTIRKKTSPIHNVIMV